MKRLRFVGSSREDLSAFPKPARVRAGQELFMVQVGREPDERRYREARALSKEGESWPNE